MRQLPKCESSGFKLIFDPRKHKHGVNCVASSSLAQFRMDFTGKGATQKNQQADQHFSAEYGQVANHGTCFSLDTQ